MIFNRWRRDEPLDHTELARLLPAPGDPVLLGDRQRLLEDFLMSNTAEDTHPAHPRRRALRRAIPMVTAVAATGAIVALGSGTTGTSPAPASPAQAVSTDANGSVTRIETASYSLEKVKASVRVTMFNKGKLVKPEQMQKDLEKFGIKSRIFTTDPACPHDGSTLASEAVSRIVPVIHADRAGSSVMEVNPSKIPAGKYLAIVSGTAAKGSGMLWSTGIADRDYPRCVASVPENPGNVRIEILDRLKS